MKINNQEHGVENFMIEKSGVETSGDEMSFNLIEIAFQPWTSTMKFSTPWFKNLWLKSMGLKRSWLQSLGLKGPGLRCPSTKIWIIFISGVKPKWNQMLSIYEKSSRWCDSLIILALFWYWLAPETHLILSVSCQKCRLIQMTRYDINSTYISHQ